MAHEPRVAPGTASVSCGAPGEEWTIFPAVVLDVGEERAVEGETVRRYTAHYACSCPAFRFHAEKDVRLRTCAHLAELLGEAYEAARVRIETPPHTPSKTRHAQATLARQRLDEHTSPESPSTPRKRRKTASPLTPTKSGRSLAPMLGQASQGAITMQMDGTTHVIGQQDERVHLLLSSTWPEWKADGLASARDTLSPAGWWISEKLDGVRAFWDGTRLWSRRGKPWNAPAWFLDRLPTDLTLDGELWMGRGLFEHTSGACRSARQDEWERVKYMVFDTPSHPNEAVEKRWERIRSLFPTVGTAAMQSVRAAGPYCVEQVLCQGQAHLAQLLETILAADGEGYVATLTQGHATPPCIGVRI